jgi:hypothetical protein
MEKSTVVINMEANSSTGSSYELGQIKTIDFRSFIWNASKLGVQF